MRGRRYIVQNCGIPFRFAHEYLTAKHIAKSLSESLKNKGENCYVEIVDSHTGFREEI